MANAYTAPPTPPVEYTDPEVRAKVEAELAKLPNPFDTKVQWKPVPRPRDPTIVTRY